MAKKAPMEEYKSLYSQSDWDQTKELIGRAPHGLYKVVKYHPQKKHPMVIQVIPWVKGAPFPTLYWLTCPILKKEISHIEKEGWVGKLEREYFSKDSDNLKALKADHERYRDHRIALLEEVGISWDKIPEPMAEIIRTTGIGGIHDFDHIKCMHLHYAHHLAEGNQVGKVMDELFNFSRFYS
ncbi:MAG: hypothetical protein CME60_12805 [Halobacteriovoraceae bacterium]|nr:hypothetical protein [Halobacteriovoraceae bacterium]